MALAIKTNHDEIDSQMTPLDSQSVPQPAGTEETRIFISLDAGRLKYIDIVPMLVERLEHCNLTKSHCQEMFVVLSELYNNALDHGILGLDSRMKSEIDGFIAFMELREELLSHLREGTIEIEMEKIYQESKAYVKLRVKDSGKGFRFNNAREVKLQERRKHSGRGIDLVKQLCDGNVKYLGNGNEVVALYPLNDAKESQE